MAKFTENLWIVSKKFHRNTMLYQNYNNIIICFVLEQHNKLICFVSLLAMLCCISIS